MNFLLKDWNQVIKRYRQAGSNCPYTALKNRKLKTPECACKKQADSLGPEAIFLSIPVSLNCGVVFEPPLYLAGRQARTARLGEDEFKALIPVPVSEIDQPVNEGPPVRKSLKNQKKLEKIGKK